MRMAWPHNPSHEFSLLTRNGSRILYHIIAFCFFIKFDSHYFNFFFFALDPLFKLIYFSILSFNIVLVENWDL